MQCSRSFLFQMCLCLLMSMGSCRCKPLNDLLPMEDPEGYYSQFAERDLIEEEDTDSRLASLLGIMKDNFLKKLNLSDVPQEPSKVYPPQFMMELYNKYATDSTVMPRSDVIRSFTVQEVRHSEWNGSRSKHRLWFNISVPNHEEVTMAELRLYALLDPRTSRGASEAMATVKVYEVDYTGNKSTTLLLDGKQVIWSQNTWESFDVTRAVQSGMKSGEGGSQFEVVVAGRQAWPLKGGRAGDLDVSVALGDNTSAALIVFSDDLGSRKREAKKELKEMILHEEETAFSSLAAAWPSGEDLPNEFPVDLHPRRRRKRRQADSSYCRRTSLHVNFKDIGWDKWIVAPPEYDAFECRGVCFFPITPDMTPSKHAIIQTLVNLRNPKKANTACCVPTKLDPITVMYQEKGVITMRHMYEEMKVAQCGCR
ncbi:growth/differentiation factor 2 [Aplochiton taeniatus]